MQLSLSLNFLIKTRFTASRTLIINWLDLVFKGYGEKKLVKTRKLLHMSRITVNYRGNQSTLLHAFFHVEYTDMVLLQKVKKVFECKSIANLFIFCSTIT